LRHLVLLIWCLFLFGYGLSGPLYRTEALRAIIGREAMTGNPLVPTLYGEPFLTKPPGQYAAIALVGKLFGDVTDWSARIPSVLAATLAVFLFHGTFRRHLDVPRAFFAAMLLPCSFLWLDKVPSAEIDMLQLFWVSAALLFFLKAFEVQEAGLSKSPSIGWWLASMLCVAGGFLTKWTAPAFFYLTVIAFLLVNRRVRWLFSPGHLLGVLLAAALCTAWALAVTQAVGWETLRETVGAEASQRFVPGARGRPYPWGESLAFPFVVLGANVPLAIIALWVSRKSIHRQLDAGPKRLALLFHCWLWPNLLFWSLPAQHNVRYLLPIVPAIAGLGILGLLHAIARLRPQDHPRWTRVVLWVSLAAWIAYKVVFVEVVIPQRTAGRNAEPTGAELSRLVPETATLMLGRLKDEGVMFYYRRPARRVDLERFLSDPCASGYLILIESEYRPHEASTRLTLVARLTDQQGDPLFLVTVSSVCPPP
jgi:4-amino-4-deoxy-L-arabinose transferase-like glycosyltransferase